jgi:hypothetical protein
MKMMQKFFPNVFRDPKDEPIFKLDARFKSLKPLDPVPYYWPLIPLKIEQIKYPQKDNPA